MGRVIVGARCICQNQRWDFVEKVEKFLDVKIDRSIPFVEKV